MYSILPGLLFLTSRPWVRVQIQPLVVLQCPPLMAIHYLWVYLLYHLKSSSPDFL